ncbi:hypothetical protein [Pseudonocardia acidicola]|uniref:Uncharacterized protein n=1 Tax=Pseudonocardia acidicola TaxID=2724939 RepID=A0ABX1SQ87_9PSEU|nr:hypothetical protein [Pseudonocardia acidicola]NMI02314.1 hypothetical protein [Pseudonocardia acidicola]
MAMAASMLRHGHAPLEVAAATGVPLALVQLLAEHRTAAPPADPAGPGSAPPPPGPQPTHPPPATRRHHRWQAWVRYTAGTAMIGNLGLALAAAPTHLPVLGLASLLLTCPLFAVLLLSTISQ